MLHPVGPVSTSLLLHFYSLSLSSLSLSAVKHTPEKKLKMQVFLPIAEETGFSCSNVSPLTLSRRGKNLSCVLTRALIVPSAPTHPLLPVPLEGLDEIDLLNKRPKWCLVLYKVVNAMLCAMLF